MWLTLLQRTDLTIKILDTTCAQFMKGERKVGGPEFEVGCVKVTEESVKE